MISGKRLRAVALSDFRIRFRKTSTAVTFVLLSLTAYLLVPDPATGNTLMEIDHHRVFYNSTSIALATACLYSILLSLFGFYLVSNSVRKDIDSRAGFIVASTPLRSVEYLAGKLFGNILFLGALAAGFLLSCGAMYLLRGEAPLEPLEFLKYYALLMPPSVVFVSVIALLFESISFLSGRLGDIVYFFFWILGIGVAAGVITADPSSLSPNQPHWTAYFDPQGVALIAQHVKTATGTGSFTIGYTPFDRDTAPVILQTLKPGVPHLLARFSSMLIPIPLLGLALLLFHRFDPTKLRVSHGKARRGWVKGTNLLLKPLARTFRFMLGFPRTNRLGWFFGAVLAEFWMVLTAYPILPVLAVASSVVSLFLPLPAVTQVLLPVAFLILIPPLAEAACRERRFGTGQMIFVSPLFKSLYVGCKFAACVILVLFFTGIGLLRVAFSAPGAALSLLIGAAVFAAVAVCLGVIVASPKAFVVVALLFWYLALSDRGRVPALDFAGWFGTAGANVRLSYAILTLLLLATAQIAYRWKWRREEVA